MFVRDFWFFQVEFQSALFLLQIVLTYAGACQQITGHSPLEEVVSLREVGGFVILTKPFTDRWHRHLN